MYEFGPSYFGLALENVIWIFQIYFFIFVKWEFLQSLGEKLKIFTRDPAFLFDVDLLENSFNFNIILDLS